MDKLVKQGLLGLSATTGALAAGLSVSGPPGYSLIAWIVAALLLCISVTARSPRWGALLTAVGCFSSNAYLFSRKWESAASTQAICNINEYLNCDKVNASSWSEAFGVPITLLGMGLYAGIAIAALVKDEEARRFYQLTTVFAAISLAYSAFLGYQSYQLGALCVLCLSIYAGNLILLWAGIAGTRLRPGAWDPAELLTSRDFITVAASFLVVVAIGGWQWDAQKKSSPQAKVQSGMIDDATLKMLYTAPCGPVETDGTEPVWGPPSAKYQVVEWADYGCPHCAEASREMRPFLEKNRDVKLSFKVYPLTGDCNPALEKHGDDRCRAAYAAECARPQGKYFEMSHMLFDNQGFFAPSDLEFIAKQVGLDVPAWQACMADPATKDSVLDDAKAGNTAEVKGTPSIFVKGLFADDRWVLIQGGVDSLAGVLDAQRAGRTLPDPAPCGADGPEH